jgi:pyrroline-5-carboxylate reductase
VYRRFELDVGMAIQRNAASLSEALARLKEVKDYVKETVAAALKKVGTPAGLTARAVAKLADSVLRETFTVFESYG